MIGNAVWSGVSLIDALKVCGLLEPHETVQASTKHLVLLGADGYSNSVRMLLFLSLM